MMAPDPYDAVATPAPAVPQADPYDAVATAAPPHSTGVTFMDTGQAVPTPQADLWQQMLAQKAIDPSAPWGDPKKPFIYRQGDNLPPGAAYIDLDGKIRVAPQPQAVQGSSVPIEFGQRLGDDAKQGWVGDDVLGVAPQRYAQPAPFDGNWQHYTWDDRLPKPPAGMAWPLGTQADPRANAVGNQARQLPGDPDPYFGHPSFAPPPGAPPSSAPAQQGAKPPGWAQDVAMTVPASLARGTMYIGTAPGDLGALANVGGSWVADKVAQALGPNFGGADPYTINLLEHGNLHNGADSTTTPSKTIFPTYAETSQEVKGLIGKVAPGQELYEPKTLPGRVANSIGELLPSTATGGEGVLGRVAPAVVGGALGQGAAEVTKGTALEPWARVLGTVAGAGGSAALTQPATVQRMLAQGARGVNQNQLDLAQALMQHGENMGVPITSAEAVQQVTGGSFPGLTRLQRVAEGTREGSSIYGPAMAQRPQQLADALKSTVLDPIAAAPGSAAALGLNAQRGAEGALKGVRSGINDAAEPYYAQLPGQSLPEADFNALQAHPSFQAAFNAVKSDPELGVRLPPGTPDNDLSRLNQVVQQLDTMGENARVSPFNPGGNNTIAGVRGDARGLADEMASKVSPEWQAARQIVSNGRQNLLDPLQQGPLGQIGQTADALEQGRALYPRTPAEGQTADTIAALRLLGGQAEGVPADLTRQHLANSFNEASRSATPDPFVGARWVKNTLGNPEQKAVTLAGTGEVAGPEIADALSRFGNVAQATGYRARQGSATAFNMEDLSDLGHGGPVGTIAKALMDPMKAPATAADAFTRWRLGRNTEALANSFLKGTPEDRAQILAEALKNHPDSAAGWASKLLLYDNPVIPGRNKQEGQSAP